MKHIFLSLMVLLACGTSARAEVFVWKDPQYDIKVTFPDNWMRQANLDDDLRLFILGPQGMDHAACRLYASHNGQFMDAPASAGQQVAAFVFDGNEIAREMYMRPDTSMVRLASYTPNGTLGRAAAAMAQVDFQKTWGGQQYPMRALVLATQYYGNHILMSCETLASAWPQWETTMKGIFKSVDFPSAFAAQPYGLYRNFLHDGQIYLPLNRRGDGITTR